MATGVENSICCQPELALTRKGDRRQLRAGARPQVAHVRAGVGARLVEANAGDGPRDIGPEFDAQLHGAIRTAVHQGRHRRGRPDGDGRRGGSNSNAQRLAARCSRTGRIGHLNREVERRRCCGRSGDRPSGGIQGQTTGQRATDDGPTVSPGATGRHQRRRVGRAYRAIGQRRRGDRERSGLHGQPSGPGNTAQRRGDRRGPGAHARGQPRGVDGGHARLRGGPRHLAGEVLRGTVRVGPSRCELLRRSPQDRRIRRRHRNRRKRRRWTRTKHHVDPVVGGIPRLRWEGRGGAVGKYAVPSRYPVGQGMQRWVVHPCRREVVHVGTVVPRVGVVRRHVHRVGRDGHRGREQHLLPARTALTREGDRRQLRAGARPQVAHVRAGVGARLVEANAGDGPSNIGSEFDAQLHGAIRTAVHQGRHRRGRPDGDGRRGGRNSNAQRLAARCRRTGRIGHLNREVERRRRCGRSGDRPSGGIQDQTTGQRATDHGPTVSPSATARHQPRRVGRAYRAIGQRRRGDRERSGLHRQPSGPRNTTQRRGDRRGPDAHARCEPRGVDGGHARLRGGPRHLAGQVLRGTVRVGPGRRELLRRPAQDRRIRRRHRNRRQRRRWTRTEHHVDPVVGGIPGLRWEGRGGAVGKYAVPSRYPVGQGMQRWVVHPCRREGVHVGTVVPRVGVVRRHVHRVGRDGHRGREQHLLPARTALIRKGDRRQLRAGARPQVAHVRAGVGARLVEANAGDGPSNIGSEFDAQLHGAIRTAVHQGRHRRGRPDGDGRRGGRDSNAQRLAARCRRTGRIGHLNREVERRRRCGRSGDRPSGGIQDQTTGQRATDHGPTVSPSATARHQPRRVGRAYRAIGQRRRGDRERSGLHRQPSGPRNTTQRRGDRRGPDAHARCEPRGVDSGHARLRGGPRHLAGKVLRGTVRVESQSP